MALIDKESIKKFIADGLNSGEFGHDAVKILAEIEYMPTVDAEPVRHGRWIYKYFDSYCSVCGWENKADTVTRIRNDYPYCPNCGAKMDDGVQ